MITVDETLSTTNCGFFKGPIFDYSHRILMKSLLLTFLVLLSGCVTSAPKRDLVFSEQEILVKDTDGLCLAYGAKGGKNFLNPSIKTELEKRNMSACMESSWFAERLGQMDKEFTERLNRLRDEDYAAGKSNSENSYRYQYRCSWVPNSWNSCVYLKNK